MTVAELIRELEKHPRGHEVVIDLHSEYAVVQKVTRIVGFDNGGYVSRAYRPEDRAKVHGYVYIDTRAE